MPLTIEKIKAVRVARGMLAALALLACLCACGLRESRIRLPANPVLGASSRWGVVNTAYLRVKTRPSSRADDLAYLRMAEVVEVQSTDIGVDTLDEEKGYWYGLKTDAGLGWAYSGYLEVYGSREKAAVASRKMGQ